MAKWKFCLNLKSQDMTTSIEKLIDTLEVHCVAAVPVGSRVTVNPPPMDTDCDILCRCENYDAYETFSSFLCDQDWEEEGDYGVMDFVSWRKLVEGTDTNLIVTWNEEFFDKFLDATVQCKKLNLQTKDERVALFDKVMGKKKPKFIFQNANYLAQLQAAQEHQIQMQQAHAQLAQQANHAYQPLGQWVAAQGVFGYDLGGNNNG